MKLQPLKLARDGDGLRITWNDGTMTFVTWLELRKNCPCAACVEERAKPPDPFRILTEREVSAGMPIPTAMKPVGRYAYKITWNDGHDTGIYSLSVLRDLSKPLPNLSTPLPDFSNTPDR